MKTIFRTFVIVMAVVMAASGCASYHYYQVAHVKSVDEDVVKKDGRFVSMGEDIVLNYDLWDDYGKVEFMVTNKSDKDLIIHMDKSFFIRNNMTYDYYGGKISGVYSSRMVYMDNVPFGDITLFLQKPELVVPAGKSRLVCDFKVSDFMYRDCDLLLYNTEGVSKKVFTMYDSPLVFENRLVYSFDGDEKEYRMNNEFYVDNITNMSESLFLKDTWVEKFVCEDEKEIEKKEVEVVEDESEEEDLRSAYNGATDSYTYDDSEYVDPNEGKVKVKVQVYKDVDRFYIKYNKYTYSGEKH